MPEELGFRCEMWWSSIHKRIFINSYGVNSEKGYHQIELDILSARQMIRNLEELIQESKIDPKSGAEHHVK